MYSEPALVFKWSMPGWAKSPVTFPRTRAPSLQRERAPSALSTQPRSASAAHHRSCSGTSGSSAACCCSSAARRHGLLWCWRRRPGAHGRCGWRDGCAWVCPPPPATPSTDPVIRVISHRQQSLYQRMEGERCTCTHPAQAQRWLQGSSTQSFGSVRHITHGAPECVTYEKTTDKHHQKQPSAFCDGVQSRGRLCEGRTCKPLESLRTSASSSPRPRLGEGTAATHPC